MVLSDALIFGEHELCIMFMGNIPGKPSRDFTRPLENS